MSDYRGELEQERRRHRMGDDSYQRLQARRDRKRRNRLIGSAILALAIAAAGGTGAVFAFRGTETAGRPGSPTTVVPTPSVGSGPITSYLGPNRRVPPQPSGPIQFVDAEHGWWIDQTGAIVATSDGGKTSSVQYSRGTCVEHCQDSKIGSLQFVNVDHGWAITADGHLLLQTADGGITWSYLGADAPRFRSIQFETPEVGWAVEQGSAGPDSPGKVLKTTDGGQTWQSLAMPALADSACFLADNATGWFGSGSTIYRTQDGGANWDPVNLDVPTGEPWTATVSCAGESDAWVLLTDGGAAGHQAHVLFHTTDGTLWRPVLQEAGTSPVGQRDDVFASPDPYPGQMTVTGPNSLAFVGWCPACGNSVDLFRTDDAGTVLGRLELAAPDHGGTPQGVSFVDPNHGFVLLSVRTDKGDEAAVIAISGEEITVWSQKTVP
jgi:photosystem II stability/assembly factor-like uncharacterized protein